MYSISIVLPYHYCSSPYEYPLYHCDTVARAPTTYHSYERPG